MRRRLPHNHFFLKNDHFFLTGRNGSDRLHLPPFCSASGPAVSFLFLRHSRAGGACHTDSRPQHGSAMGPVQAATFQVERPLRTGRPTGNNCNKSILITLKSNF